MNQNLRTVLFERHQAAGAKIVEFGGWDMPVQYPGGIVQEHLATRRSAGLFDVSHMGRLDFRGPGAEAFLQRVLTNNAAALEVGQAQYTIIPDPAGGAVDDAYLYRFTADSYLLVVNAANREKDLAHFRAHLTGDVVMNDLTDSLAMISLQGPGTKAILSGLLDEPALPDPMRNALSISKIRGRQVMIGRTGYTGEPLCFELFVASEDAGMIWDLAVAGGATPVGLGARDTLRLEAGLPLYGHELGLDADGREIPICAISLARFAVSFSPLKGDFIGREALQAQHQTHGRIMRRDFADLAALPRVVLPLAILDKALARAGSKVFDPAGREVGYVTSGTMVPYWKFEGSGLASHITDQQALRPICLALVDSTFRVGDRLQVEVRGKKSPCVVGPNLRSEAAPYARPIIYDAAGKPQTPAPAGPPPVNAAELIKQAVANHLWRQRECINLIPSEMTASPLVRMLSGLDPSFRYAEHKMVKALNEAEVFYYQGTDFIKQVEQQVAAEFRSYLGCTQVESRPISGQMANTVVFSAVVDFLNRANRRSEPRRIAKVMNNSIFKGGHLSAQPMGALRDYVARDPQTEAPAVVNFPTLRDNPYCIDLEATAALIERHRPELVILGRSVILHREPVAQIKKMLSDLNVPALLMYDAAHVLGLMGEHFQDPFSEGADVVTGSTHKTFFGTQRGIVAANAAEGDQNGQDLWEAVERRTFPGAVSNHHLGSLLGLLMAAYEMNHYKDAYQKAVVANAKAFAKALKDCGLTVSGDPAVGYTQTHQVVIEVGYNKGPALARRLEENNIIVNYQASPSEEGFSAAGSIRMGVAEMTRFGMGVADFQAVAELIRDVIAGKNVAGQVKALRGRFVEMQYCFTGRQFDQAMQKLHELF